MAQPIGLDDLISHVLARHPDGDALERLADAAQTSAHLGELADHLIGHFVDQARHAGASWTEIGQHMGVTKQAAQKRFVPRESDDLGAELSEGRFSRFTVRARNVVARARLEAEDLGHSQVEPSHVLLGLLSEPEGLAARALVALGAPLDQVVAAARAALGPGAKPIEGAIRFSRASKKLLELSLREALHLGHNYIGTEHILLGILRSDDDPAAAVLTTLGVTRAAAEQWLIDELATLLPQPKNPPAGG